MKKNTELTQQYFDALSKGDFAVAGTLFADDIIWHQPGKGALSGIVKGKEALFNHLGKFMQLSNGTFAIDKVDYLTGNEDLVAASVHFKATANGRSITMNGIDLMRIEENKIKEVWLFSEDIDAEDSFWTAMAKK